MKVLPLRPRSEPSIVPHSRPSIGPDEERAALRVLRSGRLAPGGEAARLERLVARLADGADAVALASGTVALTLALRALRIGPGDDVAIPSYSCAALLHAVRAAGAEPLVCDIEPFQLALAPDDLDRRSTDRLRAAIIVHPFGLPVPLDRFRGRGLRVVEDCAQALGATDRHRPVGSRGDVAIVSFAPTKVITCGGPGGALVSRDGAVVRAARSLATHDARDDRRARLNALMGDLHAAIASSQIDRIGEFLERRSAIAARYDVAFADLPFQRHQAPPDTRPIVFRYLVRVPCAATVVSRLQQCGVMARRPIDQPLHRSLGMPWGFPATDAAHAEIVSLPVSPSLTDDEVDCVIEAVRHCLAERRLSA